MIINVANPIYDSVFKFLMDMNVEDEYFSAIENRDTELMLRDKKIEEKNKKIEEMGSQLKTMAQAMLDNGLSMDIIAQAMGRSGEEIQSLLNS